MTSSSHTASNSAEFADSSLEQALMTEAVTGTAEHVLEEQLSVCHSDSTNLNVAPSESTATDTGTNEAIKDEKKTYQQQYPSPSLTFVDPAPTLVPFMHLWAGRSTADPPPSPPPGLKVLPKPIDDGSVFDPHELRQEISLADLPPRPPPKRNFFPRLFKL
jgi:hypothetical protein